MRYIISLCVFFASIIASAQISYSRYDVNNDHTVNVSDVTALVNIILGTEKSTHGDVNGDEAVNVNDVTSLVDFILGKRVISGHEFVDLGLPSGTLWATNNMGASNPDDVSEYYAWGEINAKKNFMWSNYLYCMESSTTLTRYNSDIDFGSVDNMSSLVDSDDAAHVIWGGLWRIPTIEQAQELKERCSWLFNSTLNGYVVTGPNGNSIFLPVTGYIKGSTKMMSTSSAYFWTRTLSSDNPSMAYSLVFEKSGFEKYMFRYYGLPIRPVAK